MAARRNKKEDIGTSMPNDLLDNQANTEHDKHLFSKGNQLWKARTKHGREKLFTKPEILLEACLEYFQYCDENPLVEHDYTGKDAKSVMKFKLRAYTWAGLEVFLGITDDGLRNYRKNDKYKDFFGVITYIEKIMWNQKFTGAAAGMLNANIIARDLGLTEKVSNEVSMSPDTMETFKIGDKVITFGNAKK